jgi:hypothetical protein
VKPVAEIEAKVMVGAETKTIVKANRKDLVIGSEHLVRNIVALRRLGIVVEVEEGRSDVDVVEARKEHFARSLRKQSNQKSVKPDLEVFIDENGNAIAKLWIWFTLFKGYESQTCKDDYYSLHIGSESWKVVRGNDFFEA